MKRIVWLCVGLLLSVVSIAQEINENQCAIYKRHAFQSAAKTTIANNAENDYDVKYVKLDISLTNLSSAISGTITTHAVVTAAAMPAYVFEMDTPLVIDAVNINGTPATVVTNGLVHIAALNTPLAAGQAFTAQVTYHGQPVPGNGYFQNGINTTKADPWGVMVTYTLSEPYMANRWWPCKQSLTDKIDSADIWISVPAGLKAGSNGRLQNITTLSDGRQCYEWHTTYPIAYYLLSAAVAPYADYSYNVSLPGMAGTMPVQNYIYDAPGALVAYKNGADSTTQMLQHFSELFGLYPFYKEKYGHCIVPLPGGMEHQTMTTQGDFGPLLTAHELAHQWFGDHVTCGSWRDIWLNEGFASYAEYLFLQKWRSNEAAGQMQTVHNRIINNKEKAGSIYVDDTTSDDRIFDGRLSYDKASAVIHTLRYVINDDGKFFGLLRAYQQLYAFGTATTADFIRLAEQYTSLSLQPFFDQWIYGQGYPVYTTSWNKIGEEVFIKLKQNTAVPSSVALYKTKLAIKLNSRQGDTIITIDNNANEQLIKLSWDKVMTGVTIDPDNWILNDEKGSWRDPELGLNEVSSTSIVVSPNPATDYWTIMGLPENCDVWVIDMSGRVVQQLNNGTQKGKVIYANGMAKGLYILHISSNKKNIASIKLSKY